MSSPPLKPDRPGEDGLAEYLDLLVEGRAPGIAAFMLAHPELPASDVETLRAAEFLVRHAAAILRRRNPEEK